VVGHLDESWNKATDNMYRLTTPTNMTDTQTPFDFDGYIAV